MTQLVYDDSFAGLLTTIFEIFEKKIQDFRITGNRHLQALSFYDNANVITDDEKANRVLAGLKKKISANAIKNIYWSFLSEMKDIENTIAAFILYVYKTDVSVESDFGNAAVLGLSQTSRKVGREKHRFEAFVRFEQIADNFYYAAVDPDYNVLPLILPHFKRRYPAQSWIIYDTKRKYGIHYDHVTEIVQETTIQFAGGNTELPAVNFTDIDDSRYKDLWRNYFKSVNIEARKNTRLHLQHVPKRYWKYLVEKNSFL